MFLVETVKYLHPCNQGQARAASQIEGVRLFATAFLSQLHFHVENAAKMLPLMLANLWALISMLIAQSCLVHNWEMIYLLSVVSKCFLICVNVKRIAVWIGNKVRFHMQC